MSLYKDMKQAGRLQVEQDLELQLLEDAQNGSVYAQNFLCETLYFTIIKLASSVAGPTTPEDAFDDLLSAGIEGALTAIHRHSRTKTCRLHTFANAHILGMVKREVSKSFSPLHVPHNAVGEARALDQGATPGDLGITGTKAFSLLSASQPRVEFPDQDPEQHPIHLDDEFGVLLRASLDQLDPDAHFILAHTYGIAGFAQLTKKEIAQTYGLTVREVQAILEDAIEVLQELLDV